MRIKGLVCALVTFLVCAGVPGARGITLNEAMEAALRAYTQGDYPKAVQILQAASAAEPNNAEIHLLLAKNFYELQERDRAVASAERAVAIDPKNSVYHEWLGRTYGEKADHSGWFSALSLAKKARKEFATAVELNERNFSAMQALIEFDCSAPGIAGGGEDKAAKEIEKIASLDVAEGHYARGNCRRQKKDYAVADAEFTKALDSNLKSADLVYDIGDYAMKQDQADRLLSVVQMGQKLDPKDPRGAFYLATAQILRGEKIAESEKAIREYLEKAPKRNNYPSPAIAHYWLGRLAENQKSRDAAIAEYETALKLEPKNRYATEALKRIKKQ
ncbi:MAG: tetratricopeptide repeat protein [Acidobacteria bacterium]|nr:tetratricopeptide repeat protein [Acidobacteriota bacterium]MBS1865307.1 tetratricopeptide repeat protein [Acidobacteriota bacterium]